MPKKKPSASKRVNVYIHGDNMKTAEEIDNLSEFFNLALILAADLMAWAILQKHDPLTYYSTKKTKELVDKYNKKYPLDSRTAKRLGKNGESAKARNQRFDQESNPLLR